MRFAIVLLLSLGAAAYAREKLHLQNGYVLEADSHDVDGGILSAHTGTGTLQFPIADVERIESLPDPPPSLVQAPKVSDETLLKLAAQAQGVDAAFVRSVAIVESGLRQTAVSTKGARGLMQLMPGTAAEMQIDAAKADSNALGGAMYLRKLLLAYKGDSGLALAAYNAGPGSVKHYGGIPPYRETRAYVVKVLKEYDHQLKLATATAKVNSLK